MEYEEPLWSQRNGFLPEAEVGGEPPEGVAADVIGRGSDGAVVYARLSNLVGDRTAEFCRERQGDVSTSLVSGLVRLELAQARWEQGTVAEISRVTRAQPHGHRFATEQYRRQAGRIVAIMRVEGTLDRSSLNVLSEREFTVEYDQDEIATIFEPAHGYVLYRRPKIGTEDLPAHLKHFRQRLETTVFALATTTAKPPETVYALLLEYEAGADVERALLPRPLWAVEAERRELTNDPERAFVVWDPGLCLPLPERATRDHFASLEGAAFDLGWSLQRELYPARRQLLIDVARTLNRRSWSALPITDDFVVAPAEHSLTDAHENLHRAASPAQWGRLLGDGWVEQP
jgi:hypothetical protein